MKKGPPRGSGNQPRTLIVAQMFAFVKGVFSCQAARKPKKRKPGPEVKACAATPEGLGLAGGHGLR